MNEQSTIESASPHLPREPRHVDVVVLGAGPGGYTAAIRAGQLGKSVAVVESQYWGGVCLNIGCIPSKALLRNAEIAHLVSRRAEDFGIRTDGDVTVDYTPAFMRSRRVANGRAKGVHFLMRKNDITQYDGWGTFTDPHTLRVTNTSGRSTSVTFDHAIIATGATPRLLPGTRRSPRVLTYAELIMQEELPGSIVIVGAGAIGVEFAYIMSAYGVEVTLVESLDRMVPLEDPSISNELTRHYRKLGIRVRTSARVENIEDTGSTVHVTISHGPQREELAADQVLQAIGFTPRTSDYGLENTDVEVTEGGAIGIDDHMRTSVPHIYAIGDVTGRAMLAHTAEAQGIVASETIGGAETMPIDYAMIPRATYSQPQIAAFGYTEQQAKDLGHDVKTATVPFMANGKAHGIGETNGFVSIVTDTRYNEILGAHMIGPDVTELLPELTLAQKWDLTADEIGRNIHAHPTLSETLKEAIHGITDTPINM